jgi:hypothetical protein
MSKSLHLNRVQSKEDCIFLTNVLGSDIGYRLVNYENVS